MERVIKVNRSTHISACLTIWNGSMKLTNKELAIVKAIISVHMECVDSGTPEKYINNIVWGKETMSKIKEDLGISKQNWGNYRASLIVKQAFIEEDGEDRINPLLLPQEVLTFKFILE